MYFKLIYLMKTLLSKKNVMRMFVSFIMFSFVFLLSQSSTSAATRKNNVDISVTKTDNKTQISPGDQDTYTIVVTNPSNVDLNGVIVTDTLPTFFANAVWTCVPACGSGTGNINKAINLSKNSKATFSITGTVQATDYDLLYNEVHIDLPDGYTDPNYDNNTASDSTQIVQSLSKVDISVTKTDNKTQIVAGQKDTYTIVVKNNSNQDINGISVVDTMPTLLQNPSWTCLPNCGSGTGNINTTVNLVKNSEAIFTVTGTTILSDTNVLYNEVHVDLPEGLTDLNYDNNTASDITEIIPTPTPSPTNIPTRTPTPTATLTPTPTPANISDISVVKTDNKSATQAGSINTYSITVKNNGPIDLKGIKVVDNLPDALINPTWSCSPYCGSGTGNINTTIDLINGASVIYTLAAQIRPDAAAGTLSNTATVTMPNGFVDNNPSNNTSTDTTTITLPPSCSLAPLRITKLIGAPTGLTFFNGFAASTIYTADQLESLRYSPAQGNFDYTSFVYTGNVDEQINPNIHPKPTKTVYINNIAYVTNSNTNTIGIIDMQSFPAQYIKTPAPTDPEPTTITGSGNYLYVGTKTTLEIFDIASPFIPVLRSKLPINAPANDLAINGNTLFLVDNIGTFITIDVSDKNLPKIIATISFTDARLNGVVISGNYAYIVKDQILSNQLIVMNISNPDSPTVVTGLNITDLPTSITKQGDILYITTKGAYGGKLQLISVKDPSTPKILRSISNSGGLITGSYPIGNVVDGKYAYVIDYTEQTLSVYDTTCYLSLYSGNL